MSGWAPLTNLLLMGCALLAVTLQTVADAAREGRQLCGPKCPAPAPVHIFIAEPTAVPESKAPLVRQALNDIQDEIDRIQQRLSKLIEALQDASEPQRGEALNEIREALAIIVERLKWPIECPGGTSTCGGDLTVRHHIESVSEEVMVQIREALPAIVVNVRAGDSSTGACRWVRLHRITGFPPADHRLLTVEGEEAEGEEMDCKPVASDSKKKLTAEGEETACRRVASDFRRKLNGRRLDGLVLIGRADRMPFSNAQYGGNRGLAQARAKWVHDCLLSEPSAASTANGCKHVRDVLKNGTALVTGGPLHVPACTVDQKCDEDARCRDRSVDLFACLAESVESETEVATKETATHTNSVSKPTSRQY